MEIIRKIIRSKPRFFLIITAIYLVVTAGLRLLVNPEWDVVWFVLGGLIGIYFMDAAEIFFDIKPSPFRSVIFGGLFLIVSLFVVTSSDVAIGIGLVLSLFLQMLLWQIGELRVMGNLHSWYRFVSSPVSVKMQHHILAVCILIFLVETYIYIR